MLSTTDKYASCSSMYLPINPIRTGLVAFSTMVTTRSHELRST